MKNRYISNFLEVGSADGHQVLHGTVYLQFTRPFLKFFWSPVFTDIYMGSKEGAPSLKLNTITYASFIVTFFFLFAESVFALNGQLITSYAGVDPWYSGYCLAEVEEWFAPPTFIPVLSDFDGQCLSFYTRSSPAYSFRTRGSSSDKRYTLTWSNWS